MKASIRSACDRSYPVLLYAKLVMSFSKDRKARGLNTLGQLVY